MTWPHLLGRPCTRDECRECHPRPRSWIEDGKHCAACRDRFLGAFRVRRGAFSFCSKSCADTYLPEPSPAFRKTIRGSVLSLRESSSDFRFRPPWVESYEATIRTEGSSLYSDGECIALPVPVSVAREIMRTMREAGRVPVSVTFEIGGTS
jgi:hypothetical protein